MAYNGWKMMDKIDVAVRNGEKNYGGFTGYVVEHGDKKGLESAKDWARIRSWNRKKDSYDKPIEPLLHTFDNSGFTVKILKSAGGSSQGGRLSFLACEVEKDGIKFVIGVNDALLVDLIRNSHIDMGVIKEKVMFVRKGGVPGFIHENMEAYKEALADMQQKADLKSAKKTSKWEVGGVYSTLTQTDICLGEVWDTMEEYTTTESYSSYRWSSREVTKLRKTKEPKKVTAWMHWYNFNKDKKFPDSFEKLLKEQADSTYTYFSTGKPPARHKEQQLEVKDSDLELIDKILARKEDGDWNFKVKGRYAREIK